MTKVRGAVSPDGSGIAAHERASHQPTLTPKPVLTETWQASSLTLSTCPVRRTLRRMAASTGSGDAAAQRCEASYRALLEQIPAVVFMAYLDRGIGEAYVSPQIEAALGFSQEEWLEDPVRWYRQIHPEDKQRWSVEAADMFLSGKPLAFGLSGDRARWPRGLVSLRSQDGPPRRRPPLVHSGRRLRHHRPEADRRSSAAGAQPRFRDSGHRRRAGHRARPRRTHRALQSRLRTDSPATRFEEVRGRHLWELFAAPEEIERFQSDLPQHVRRTTPPTSTRATGSSRRRVAALISWSGTALAGEKGEPAYIIATGIDITERKRLEKAILEISAREQRRIGQDLHDGLGQHLTGIAFMSKVQEQKLAEKGSPDAADAAKIVRLVNEAINKTRELSRGLLPVVSDRGPDVCACSSGPTKWRICSACRCRFRLRSSRC